MTTAAAKTDDFISCYDRYSKMYCDPVEVLFGMAADVGLEAGFRIQSAKELVSYRYPKQKAIDITAGEGVQGITFVMGPQIENQVVNQIAVLSAPEEFQRFDSSRLVGQDSRYISDDQP